ncbi:PREDICTED: sideroflexin-4 isoform X5 [Haliaeetus leucocephalus]|uniref:sideroflexin-4 isoform X5 n=1 Tax=Haliaeetus leucocephalus TaxID=52644 RepID=UPI00053CBB83|nr:PREDICTED: sideroflexin-4 isoform X5 [Haliaeetus leucocephalus]
MDPNLRFWRTEGQSFFQRFLRWVDVLDPLLLLKSSDEIRRTRLLLQNSGKTLSEPIQNDQTKQAFLLSLSSVHPDTDKIIPVLFRPPAFMPISLPLEYSLQQKQIFCGLGAITYAACIGALPLVFMNRYTLKSSLTQLVVKKLLPAPLFGLMSAFTVVVVRSPEFENGIEVMDSNGKVVGVSQKAGEKAVKETALSRAVLFGTTFFLPAVLMYFVERAKFAKTPHALASVRMFVVTSVLAGMLPVSLSMFPQCGVIKRADLEPEILSSTEETELFYNRGI